MLEMYHNQPNRIELHDDVVGVEKSKLLVKEGEPVRLQLTLILRPDRPYVADEAADVRLHSTNGVAHRWYPVGSPDPALDQYRAAKMLPAERGQTVQPVEDGLNRAMFYDDLGNPQVSTEPFVDPNSDVDGAPNSAYETRTPYNDSLAYVPSDFNDGLSQAERDLRRQQALVDRTTAKKRREGSGPGTANSMRQEDAEKEESDNRRKEDRKDRKDDAGDDLKSGDSVKLDKEDKKGK